MKFIFTIFLSLAEYILFAQTSISGIINSYARVDAIYLTCPDSILVSNSAGFSAGDSILIVQMQGAFIDSSNSSTFGKILDFDKTGNYEFIKIGSISGNTFHFTSSLINLYNVLGNVQVVNCPNFLKANINGTLTAQPWDGNTGGILSFVVSDTLFLNADIDLTGTGFRGGAVSDNYSNTWNFEYSISGISGSGGQKGEGIAAYVSDMEFGRAPQSNGGGGGMDMNTGGAGGSNYGKGGHGGNNIFAPDTLWGLQGVSLDSGYSQNKIFLGGGGGGGHQNDSDGTSGSNGGGILLIRANNIVGNNYFIRSNGANVTSIAGMDGAGGGGGGGCVLLGVKNILGNLNIEALGGNGGEQNFPVQCIGNGGGGGGGAIFFSGISIPGNVITDISGGKRGLGQCNNSGNDATDGDSGIVVFGWRAPKLVEADAGGDVSICFGNLVQIGTAAEPGMQYQWNNGVNGALQTINPLTNTSIILTVSDGLCHYGYDTISINVIPYPVSSFAYTRNCTNLNLINNSNAGSYTWNFGDGTSSSARNPIHTYLNSGNYTVNLISRNGNCSTSSSQNITIELNQQPAMSYSNGRCDSTFYFINQSINPQSSQWKFGDGDSSSSLNSYHVYNNIGNVQVQLISTSQSGCIDTINENIHVMIKSLAKFNYYVDSCASKIFFTSKSPMALSYHWNFGDNETSTLKNPIHNYLHQKEYTVTLTVNEGTSCPESTSIEFTSPADGLYTVYVPNSFTPNGDSNNEMFYIVSKMPCDQYTLIIYNRWGEEIFKTEDPLNVGWDGYYNGIESPEGVYVYLLKGTNTQKTGNILLAR